MSMVHLADPLYYKELEEATDGHDRVLYELIVDEDVTTQDATGWRRLKEPMVTPYPAHISPSSVLLVPGPPRLLSTTDARSRTTPRSLLHHATHAANTALA